MRWTRAYPTISSRSGCRKAPFCFARRLVRSASLVAPGFIVADARSRERRQYRDVERALDEPDPGGHGDQRRAAGQHDAPIRPGSAQPEGHRQEDADDRELPKLHADVKAEERQCERARLEAEVAQRAGESEAVNQPEAECGKPA